MIFFEGTEQVSNIVSGEGQSGRWHQIHFSNGLNFSTFSETAIEAANESLENNTPLALIGTIKAREWQGKCYPTFLIEMAWVRKSATKAEHEAKISAARPVTSAPAPQPQKEGDDEDLPF